VVQYYNEFIEINAWGGYALPIDQNINSIKVYNGGSFYCIVSTTSAADGVIVAPQSEFDFGGKKNQLLIGTYYFSISTLFVKIPLYNNPKIVIIIKRVINAKI
jgi:hypothetical protein